MPQSELKSWAVARLDDIPDDHPEGWWDHEAATPGFGKRWHSVRRFFGINGFGIAASGADAGDELIVALDTEAAAQLALFGGRLGPRP